MYSCKRPNSQRSAEIIAGNDDLLTEIILLHLSAKSLLRFQSVCKHWHSLISAPFFSNNHAHNHHLRSRKPQPTFILRLTPPRFSYFNLATKISRPFDFKAPYTRILQSCNGLLLLECRNFQYGFRNYCVYNPTTKRQSRILRIDYSDMYISGLCLVFDPSKSPHYKIVCLWKQGSNCKIEVFNSESQTWNCVRDTFPFATSTKFSDGIYRNNRIYWIRPFSRSFYLDLETGSFGTPPLLRIPRPQCGEVNKNYVMESNGHIHCVSIYMQNMQYNKKCLVVFELSDDDSGWFEKYFVDLNPIEKAFPKMDRRTIVVGIVRGSREEDSLVLLHFWGKVVCYRFFDGSFEVVLDLKDRPLLLFQRNNVYQFMESLVPV